MLTRKPLPPEALPDPSDPNGYCVVCNLKFVKVASYRQHLRRTHEMKLAPVIRRPPGSNVSPSSNHCQSCDWTFFSEESYQHHQETVHKINIPKSQRSTSSSNILPDTHDPNFYCKPCQHTYKPLQIYRSHLKRIHNMDLTPLVKKTMYDPTISADVLKDPKNTSCPICKCTYSNRNKYRRHMATIHKDGKNTPVCRNETINSSNIQPDPNDPNLHCAACQRVYSNRQVYRHHLRLQHPNVKMYQIKGGVQSTISPIMAEMDAGNPNNTWCNIWEEIMQLASIIETT